MAVTLSQHSGVRNWFNGFLKKLACMVVFYLGILFAVATVPLIAVAAHVRFAEWGTLAAGESLFSLCIGISFLFALSATCMWLRWWLSKRWPHIKVW